jgi:DNA polymerase-3 subunit alpha
MGKKQIAVLNKMKVQFIEGATGKGHPKDTLEKIWKDWEAFAQYAFNKSHSTCYAFVAYQTAYLKAHYPSEYMAAVLNHAGSIDKITFFMEECKRMGLKVLGPDINESQSGFAVNRKGEIRFGFSGLKGVGESAIDHIIEEKSKHGPFKNIFDFVKRVNLRAVNKKSMESLIYSGAFDCFPDYHRAQYFYQAPGDVVTLEKILKFGAVFQSQSASSSNTLFGDLQMPEIVPPKIAPCPPWQLVEQLDFEKEITGMYISGHPLDNFRFELTHYHITPLADYNDVKNAVGISPGGRSFRLAGLVIDGQHRLTKTGKNFGILQLEDFSGKAEFALFGEDYARYNHYMEKGMILMLEGGFRQRYNSDQFEFKINRICLLETIKSTLTKQLIIEVPPQFVDDGFVSFIEQNIRQNPGKSSIRFNITDTVENRRISLYSLEKGFSMNDDLVSYLNKHQELETNVQLA